MPGGQQAHDYVGYTTGQPAVLPVGGFIGLLDFTGFSVGRSAVVPVGGLRGLLDFTGYSVGKSAVVVDPHKWWGYSTYSETSPGTWA